MRALGIDLGSREVKIVVMQDGAIVQMEQISTMKFYRDFCHYEGKIVVNMDKLNVGNFDIAISTGYGRNNINLEKFKVINEVKAHVKGAKYQSGLENFVLLDMGGQDIKIMLVEKGKMIDMELNDKCAASCGRYLENMAHILEVDLDELSIYSKDPVILNSTCAVFTESELIAKIAEGVEKEVLCAGINFSLYNRLKPLLRKFKSEVLVVAGGVSYNQALLTYLKQDYAEILRVNEPQFNGAIGCCVIGLEQLFKEQKEEEHVLIKM